MLCENVYIFIELKGNMPIIFGLCVLCSEFLHVVVKDSAHLKDLTGKTVKF